MSSCSSIPRTDPNFAAFVASAVNADPNKPSSLFASGPYICSSNGIPDPQSGRVGWCKNVTDPSTTRTFVACYNLEGSTRCFYSDVSDQGALQACQQSLNPPSSVQSNPSCSCVGSMYCCSVPGGPYTCRPDPQCK